MLKFSPAPLTGRTATQECLKTIAFRGEIWVKVSWDLADCDPPMWWKKRKEKDGTKVPIHYLYRGIVEENGNFSLTQCVYQGKDENDNAIWTPTGPRYADGFSHLSYLTSLGGTGYFYPNQPLGGIRNAHVTDTDRLFYEIDDLPLAQQQEALNKLYERTGLEPAAVVFTGGKSLHVYFRLKERIAPDHWLRLNRKLTVFQNSDPAICNVARAMRLPGLVRRKLGDDGQLTAPKDITLEYSSAAAYTAEAVEAALDSTGVFPYGLSDERWRLWRKAKLNEENKNKTSEELQEILHAILRKPEADLYPKAPQYESRDREFTYDGSTIPLEVCLAKADRDLIQNGVGSGDRDNSGYKLTRNLIGTANQLTSLGIRYSSDPRSLFDEFCSKCNPPLPSRDIERIWRSASKGNPSASLTDDALKNCIAAYQYRQNPQSRKTSTLNIDRAAYEIYRQSLTDEERFEAAIARELKQQADPWAFTLPADLLLNQRYFEVLPLPALAQWIVIVGGTGTGKTQSIIPHIAKALAAGQQILVITNRVTTGRALGEVFGVPYIDDAKTCDQGTLLGITICVESLHPNGKGQIKVKSLTNPEDVESSKWRGALVIFDEVDQTMWQMLNSSTCRKGRPVIWETFEGLLKDVITTGGQVITLSADISDLDIELFSHFLGVKPWVCRNEWRPERNYKAYIYPSKESLYKSAVDTIKGKAPNKCVWMALEGQKPKTRYGTQCIENKLKKDIPGIRVLRIDSETLSDPNHPAYGCVEKLNEIVKDYDVVVASTSISSAVSLDEQGRFAAVFDISVGLNSTRETRQRYNRVREGVDRHLFVPRVGLGKVGNGSTFYKDIDDGIKSNVSATLNALKRFDFKWEAHEPILTIQFAKRSARINVEMHQYYEKTRELLESEGVEWIEVQELEAADRKEIAADLKNNRDELWDARCVARASVDIEGMTHLTYETLEKKMAKTQVERDQCAKFRVCEAYGVEPTPELFKKDDEGWYPQLRLLYWLTRDLEFVKERDHQHLDKYENGRAAPHDIRLKTAEVQLLKEIGLAQLLHPTQVFTGTHPVVLSVVENAIARQKDVHNWLGVKLTTKLVQKPMQAIHSLLKKVGVSLKKDRKRIGGSHPWVYTYVPDPAVIPIFEAWELRDRTVVEKLTSASCVPTPLYSERSEGLEQEVLACPVPTPQILEVDSGNGLERPPCGESLGAEAEASCSYPSNIDIKERVGSLTSGGRIAGDSAPGAVPTLPVPLLPYREELAVPKAGVEQPSTPSIQVGAVVRWRDEVEKHIVTAVGENYLRVKSLLSGLTHHTAPPFIELVEEAIAW